MEVTSTQINYATLLDLARAKTEAEGTPGFTNDGALVIYWDGIPKAELENASDWMITNRSTISNFTVEYRKYDGTWRSVKVETQYDPKRGGVLRWTLAYGYITELVTGGALVWTEARLVDTKDYVAGTNTREPGGTSTENYLVVYWKNVSPNHVQTIVATINALTVAGFNPVIKGQTYPTSYHRIYTASKIVEDGSAEITLFLAKPEYTLSAYHTWSTGRQNDVYYHWNVPKELAQALLNSEKGVGKTAVASYGKDGLVDITITSRDTTGYTLLDEHTKANCDQEVYQDFYWGISNPTLYTVPTTGNINAGDTYTRDVQSNHDGTYDIILTHYKTTTRTYPTRNYRVSTLGVVYEYKAWGAPVTYLTDIGAPPQGMIYTQDQDPREDCTRNITLRSDLSVSKVIPFDQSRATLLDENAILYKNSRSVLQATDSDTATIYNVQQSINEDGTYDGTLVYRVSSQSAVQFDSRHSAFKDAYGIVYNNYRTMPSIPAITGSGIYTLSVGTNQDGTYDAQLLYTQSGTGTNAKFLSRHAITGVDSQIVYKDNASVIESPTDPSLGVIYEASSAITEEGTYNGNLVYRASIPFATNFIDRTSAFKNIYGILYTNYQSKPTLPAITGSGIYNLDLQLGADGTYSARLLYTESAGNGVAAFASQRAKLQSENSVIYKDSSSAVNADASGLGFVYESTNSITEEGLYNAQLVYRMSHNFTTQFDARRSVFKNTAGILYNNAIVLPALAQPDSGVYTLQVGLNKDGTYDGNIMYTYSTNNGSALFRSMQSALGEDYTAVYKDWGSAVVANTPSVQGVIYVANNRLTEDGTYDSTWEQRASTSNKFTVDSYKSPVATETTGIYRNIATAVAAPSVAAGQIYNLRHQINQDGTYDVTVALQAASTDASLDFHQHRSALLYRDKLAYWHKTAAITDTDPTAQGYIYDIEHNRNEDGTYNIDVVYSKSNAKEIYSMWNTTKGIAWTKRFVNQAAEPSDVGLLTTAANNDVTVDINPDGTYDFTIRSHPGSTDSTNPNDWDDTYTRWRYSVYDREHTNQIYVEVYVYQNQDLDTCRDFLNMAPAAWGELSFNMPGTGIHYLGGRKWRAERVRQVDKALWP